MSFSRNKIGLGHFNDYTDFLKIKKYYVCSIPCASGFAQLNYGKEYDLLC